MKKREIYHKEIQKGARKMGFKNKCKKMENIYVDRST